MKGKKEQDGPVAFIKSDKSRIIEVSEGKEGKFEVVGVYHRIDVANISLGSFHPKKQYGGGAKNISDAKEEENTEPLTKGFNIPREKIEEIALLIEGRATKPVDICTQTEVSMPTFMRVFYRLKELGKIDGALKPKHLGKPADGDDE